MPREKRGDDRVRANAIDEQRTVPNVAADVSTSRSKKAEENCTSPRRGRWEVRPVQAAPRGLAAIAQALTIARDPTRRGQSSFTI